MNRDGGLVPMTEWAAISRFAEVRALLGSGAPATVDINRRCFVRLSAFGREVVEANKRVMAEQKERT